MALHAIQRNISPIPIRQRPEFLSKGIKRHAKNSSNDGKRLSVAHNFLMTLAMDLHKSVELVPNCSVIKIFHHPSASSTDGPAPPLVLTAALLTKSASTASNFIECTYSGVSVRKTSSLLLYPMDVFALTGSRFFDSMEVSRSACYQSIVSLHW